MAKRFILSTVDDAEAEAKMISDALFLLAGVRLVTEEELASYKQKAAESGDPRTFNTFTITFEKQE